MPIDFRRTRISFDPTSGREQRETGAVVFPTNVRRAEAALNGYSITYNNGYSSRISDSNPLPHRPGKEHRQTLHIATGSVQHPLMPQYAASPSVALVVSLAL